MLSKLTKRKSQKGSVNMGSVYVQRHIRRSMEQNVTKISINGSKILNQQGRIDHGIRYLQTEVWVIPLTTKGIGNECNKGKNLERSLNLASVKPVMTT